MKIKEMDISGGSIMKWMGVALVVIILAVWVWPTAWYPRSAVLVGAQVVPIPARVHRFTGVVQVLTHQGWLVLEIDEEDAAAATTASPD